MKWLICEETADILPGVGTAVGGIAGGLILGVAGSFAGSSLGKWVVDITEIGE